ncbi:MAG: flippase-like domain-containing protein [Tannerella sp.]|nr:flippase-like domain-containing protein [Tannerella sp.]
MNLKQCIRKTLRVVLPLALGCVLLWYLYKDQNLGEMVAVIKKGVRYDIILFSLVFGLLANVVRGYRWGLLTDSLGGQRVKRFNLIFSVLGMYAINMALPRVGEIWRCGVISKYDKVPFTKLIGTLLVDRVMDTLVVGLMTLCIFVFNIRFFTHYFSKNPELLANITSMFTSVWMYVAIVIIILIIWLLFTKWGHLSIIQKGKGVLLNIWEGIKSLWKMEHKFRFFLQTLMIWGGYFLYFYITFYAFGFTHNLGLRIGLIVFTMSSLSMALPVQGGIGVWHFMVISTMVSFGVLETDASAYALVVYTMQTTWTVFVGLVGIAALPVKNREKAINIKK